MQSEHDPWAEVARRGSIELVWLTEPDPHFGRPAGLTCFSELRISLRAGMDSAELRSTLAHELVHLERGPVRSAARVDPEEDIVELIAAKRLVEPAAYDRLTAAHQSPDVAQVKQSLRVDWRVFRTYRAWRNSVTTRTAHRVWRRAQATPAWPPAWFERHPAMHELAARRQFTSYGEGCL